jgi:hypothetical protein
VTLYRNLTGLENLEYFTALASHEYPRSGFIDLFRQERAGHAVAGREPTELHVQRAGVGAQGRGGVGLQNPATALANSASIWAGAPRSFFGGVRVKL